MLHHVVGFVAFVVGSVQLRLYALLVFRPQYLVEAPRIARNHVVGDIQNGLGTAVVLLQLEQLAIREVRLELFEVVRIRSAPSVNALVVIAYNKNVTVLFAEHLEDFVLHLVGILKLVDKYVLVTFTVLFKYLLAVDEKFVHVIQQVVEVKCVVFRHFFAVGFNDFDYFGIVGSIRQTLQTCKLVVEVLVGFGKGGKVAVEKLRRFVFDVGNTVAKSVHHLGIAVLETLLDNLFYDGLLFVLGVNGKVAVAVETCGFLA